MEEIQFTDRNSQLRHKHRKKEHPNPKVLKLPYLDSEHVIGVVSIVPSLWSPILVIIAVLSRARAGAIQPAAPGHQLEYY